MNHSFRERDDYGNLKKHWRIWRGRFHVEICLLSDAHFTMLSFEQDLNNNYQRQIKIGIYWLFCIFFCWRGVKYDFDKIGIEGLHREIGVRVFDGGIWFDFWGDPSGWGPRRAWSIHPLQGFLNSVFGRTNYSQVDVTEKREYVNLPEGYIPATVKRYRSIWKRPRLPFNHRSIWYVEIEPIVPVPIPGKGENSWDIEDDGIHSSSKRGYDIHQALSEFADDIIKRRLKHGGYSWRPDYGSFQPLDIKSISS